MEDRRFRGWCFTVNNYSEADYEKVKALVLECVYGVVGREVAPSTGTRHLQGYVYFGAACKFSRVVGLLPVGAHVEAAKGSPLENFRYCQKSDKDAFKHGEPKENSCRRKEADWDEARRLAREGKMDDIKSSLYIPFKRSFDSIRTERLQVLKPANLPSPCGQWWWGVPGAGKSWKARADFPDHYVKGCNKWWDGYNGQKAVIIDDLNPEAAKMLSYYLKIWSDIYPFQAETKFGHLFIRPEVFIVTSNYEMSECVARAEDLAALKRRFKVMHFPNVWGHSVENSDQSDNRNRDSGGNSVVDHSANFYCDCE